jgi:hypothetical protein
MSAFQKTGRLVWVLDSTGQSPVSLIAHKGESPAPGGGVRGFQDGPLGEGGGGRQADVWSAHGDKIRATTADFK